MIANQYHLNFRILSIENEKVVTVDSKSSSTGFELNYELAAFIGVSDVSFTQELINYINQLDYNNVMSDGSIGDEYWSYDNQIELEIFDNPKRVSFWDSSTSTYTDIPVQDFLSILQEWINFLEGLPFEYRLL